MPNSIYIGEVTPVPTRPNLEESELGHEVGKPSIIDDDNLAISTQYPATVWFGFASFVVLWFFFGQCFRLVISLSMNRLKVEARKNIHESYLCHLSK